jgi:NAD-dependent deacetylase
MMNNDNDYASAAQLLRNARHVVILTGAGISAQSGIPTFRDALTGFWKSFDPQQLATAAAFRDNPALVWGWYEWRRQLVKQARPNAAHHALVALSRRVPHVTVITQNVDDLHERAGSTEVVHLHGNINRPRCFACARGYDAVPCDTGELNGGPQEPPRCLRCNGRIRPGVVWFGEPLPQAELRLALKAAKICDLLISIGTSGVVYPAATLPGLARDHGAAVVHINTDSIEVQTDLLLQGSADACLIRLLALAFGNTAIN